ncbi:MAG: hypothetical protein JNM66_08365 [Bryobacterales bacterium]|nr:hypothetical protein [Bryobacterales bacterium]
MDPITLATLSNAWLLERANHVGGSPALLGQGYQWTGFAYIRNGEIDTGTSASIDWNSLWDVRLFGPRGEWHCWNSGDGKWRARFVAQNEWGNNALERCYVLRGQDHNGDWIQETSGASLFFPFPVERPLRDRPLRLRANLEIALDPLSGLAFFRDAMLIEVVQD